MKQGPTVGFENVLQAIKYVDNNSTVFKKYQPYLRIKFFLERQQIEYMMAYVVRKKKKKKKNTTVMRAYAYESSSLNIKYEI